MVSLSLPPKLFKLFPVFIKSGGDRDETVFPSLIIIQFQMMSERKLVPYMGFSVPRYSHTVAAMSE